MAIDKFAIRQKVRFTPEMGQVANRGETFVVMRHLPEASGAFQYQIKSKMDVHARVVRGYWSALRRLGTKWSMETFKRNAF